MDWWQVLAIAGSTLGSVWIMHRENIKEWKERAAENKDFHGRMCTLEERYYQLLQKYLENRGNK